MIFQFSYAVILAGALLLVIFTMIEYIFSCDEQCQHPNKTTYNSYHKQVCVDCLQDFPTDDV